MIFDKPPATWQELQARVHQAFIEMGCAAESPKAVQLVRGKKEVDVWVREVIHAIETIYFVECKFWGQNVPQNEAHAFRTVVADGGAHKGIIIAKKGFEEGAYEAVVKSNVDILTWEEFNERFFDRWKNAVTAELRRLARDVMEFSGSPYYRFKDRFKRGWTPPLMEAWAEVRHIASATATVAMRDIMRELDAGPVRVVRPEFDPKTLADVTEEKMFITFKTHRECYEYVKPRLIFLRQKIDDWYALYEREGGDAKFRTTQTIDDE
jgi:hypothetical protein